MRKFPSLDEIQSDWPGVFWAGVLALAVMIGLFSRRASVEAEYPGKTILRVQFPLQLPEVAGAWEQIVEGFQKDHPDVVVLRVDSAGSKRNIIEAAGMLPDVLASNTFSLYRNEHSLMPLDELVRADAKEIDVGDFYPDILQTCRYRNDLLIIPYFFNVSLLYYNVDMFRDAGIAAPDRNWNWEKYVQVARKLARFDRSGRQVRWGTAIVLNWWVEWLAHVRMAGGEFISDDWQRCLMDSPQAVEGLRFYRDLVLTYKVAPPPREMARNSFLNQQTAMQYAGHTADWVGLRANAKFSWDVALLPKGPLTRRGGERVTEGLGINRRSRHPLLAWAFIKHLTGFSGMKQLVDAGYVPVRRSVAEHVFLQRRADGRYRLDPQHKEVVFGAMKYGVEQPSLPEFPQLAYYQAQPQIDRMLRGEISPEECGRRIAAKVTAVLHLLNRRNPQHESPTVAKDDEGRR